MNKKLLVLSALLASACSHLEVTGYDRQSNTVAVQTGRMDSKNSATAEARKYCASKVTLTNPDAKAENGITVYKFTCDR